MLNLNPARAASLTRCLKTAAPVAFDGNDRFVERSRAEP